MGLPLFIAPVEPEVAPKAADKSTSTARSSIRRQRTIRGPSARHNAAEARRRRILSMVADTTPEDYEAWELRRASPLNEGEEPSAAPRRGEGWRHSAMRQWRDPVRFERENPHDDGSASMMPPVPETRDFYAIGDRHNELHRLRQRQDLQRLARNPAPAPPFFTSTPYTDTDLAFLARIGLDVPQPASSTPALPPARQPTMDDAEAPPRRPQGESLFTRPARASRGASDRPSRQTISERIANRISMNNPERVRRIARQEMDGLGDRERSISPDRSIAWDTLLTSITPDPQPPSAGSSFASASAAAAATSSASGSASASTSMTSIGLTEEPSAIRDCDISDSASNTEDEDDIYELQEFSRGRDHRSWRSYADVVTPHPHGQPVRPQVSGDTEDLGGMHRIISRLAERDEIPEEWWASAGLSRNLRREPTG